MMSGNFTTVGGVYVDPFLKRQKIEDMAPEEYLSVPISDLNQTGQLIAGEEAEEHRSRHWTAIG